ncbi:MAG TPA: response regulator [Rhizomicrobium sp.]|nr:response regulator [Rhizomicrobium sp.]
MIVDDGKLARMALGKVLSGLRPDWSRLEAANADEAVSMVKSAAPDIAIFDFNMPGRDGLALAAETRSLRPDMPIAVISANHQQEVVDRAQAMGAQFLSKPITEQGLRDFVSSAEKKVKGGA